MTASAVDAECGTSKTAAQSGADAASTEGGLDEEDEESIDGLSVQRCLCRLEKAVARFKAQKAREDLGGELLQEVRAMGQRLDAIVETVSVVKAQNDELEKLAGNDSLRRIDSMHETLVELSVWKIQQAQLVDQLEVAVQCVGDRCDLLNISAADARAEEAEWRSKMSTKHDQVTAVVSKLEGYVQQTMLIEETLGKELKQVKSRSVRHGTAIAELPKMQSVLAELEEERIEVPRSRIVEAEQAVVQFKKDVGKLLETKVSVDLVPTIATKADLSKVDAKVEMQLTAFEAQKKLLYATHEEVAKAGIGVMGAERKLEDLYTHFTQKLRALAAQIDVCFSDPARLAATNESGDPGVPLLSSRCLSCGTATALRPLRGTVQLPPHAYARSSHQR